MLELFSALFQRLSPLWEMSVTAAYAAAVVIVLRLLLKKRAPKQVLCLLWLVVFARLLIPVSLESPLSIVPDALPGPEQQVQLPAQASGDENPATLPQSPVQSNVQGQPTGGTIIPAITDPADPVLSTPEGMTPALPQQPEETPSPWQAAAAGVWLAGAVLMGGYALVSYLRLRRRLFDAIRARDGAWEHPDVDSPFILGMFRPRIYLPAGLVGRPRKFILCHERAHLRRFDHIVKPVCWVALALHWFNPLVWAAYILMSRDIESACDEAVIRRLGSEVKADYSTTLLALATGRHTPSPCPLAFDEGDARGRIQNVLRYQRPALWIVVVSAVMAVMTAVCLLTDPVSAEVPEDSDADPSPDITATQPPETAAPAPAVQLDAWMKGVLDGERDFVTAGGYDDSRTYTINDLNPFFYGDSFPDAVVTVDKAAILDMDRDGINELIVWPSNRDVVGYLILRRQGDAVFGYAPRGIRSCNELKADGTFWWSSSSARNGTASMTFEDNQIVDRSITWCEPTNDYQDELYFVDGRKATQAEFEAACAAQSAKPEPTWYVYENGALKALSAAGSINVPIPLDDTALSVAVPDFLDADQQLLYRQTYAMYTHIFGTNSEMVDSWPEMGMYGPDQIAIGDYTPATALYANWDDFEEAVLSVFTQEYWDAKNNMGDGRPVYKNIDGQLYYIAMARGGGGYNENFPETFRLVEQTDDTISFIMTGYYSDSRQVLGIGATSEQQEAWLAAGWEGTIEFPMRMVKTESGWRFDEFHCARTDNGLLEFSSQMVPNPNAPAAPAVEPTPTPERTVLSEYGGMQIVSVGSVYRLHWNQNGQDFPVGPDAVSPGYNPWVEDFDEDGEPEAIFPENGSFPFTIYDFVDNALVGYPFPYDLDQLYADISQNSTAAYNPETRLLTVTYLWNGAYVSSRVTLPAGFFEGYGQLADGRPLYAALSRGAVNGVLLPAGQSWYRAEVRLTDGTVTGPVVGNLNFTVQYSNSGFALKDPGEIQWLPSITG